MENIKQWFSLSIDVFWSEHQDKKSDWIFSKAEFETNEIHFQVHRIEKLMMIEVHYHLLVSIFSLPKETNGISTLVW